MLDINLTLFIQMFHFYCAYLLLRFFFLKPIVQIIYQDDREKNELLSLLHKDKEVERQKEQEEKERWKALQRQFFSKMPKIDAQDATHFKIETPSITPVNLDSTLLSQEIKKIEDKIMAHLDPMATSSLDKRNAHV